MSRINDGAINKYTIMATLTLKNDFNAADSV